MEDFFWLKLLSFDVGELPREEGCFPVLIIQSVLSVGVFCVFLVITIFNDFPSAFEPLCILLYAVDWLLISWFILGGIVLRLFTVPWSRTGTVPGTVRLRI